MTGAQTTNAASNRLFDEDRSGLEKQGQQQAWPQWQWDQRTQQEEREHEASGGESAASITAGAIVAALGLSRKSLPGMLCAGLGGLLVYNGFTGRWPGFLQGLMEPGTDPQRDEDHSRGVRIMQAMLINKSPEELYRFWRNFENLPRAMKHLRRVQVLNDRRSRWTARGPMGKEVEWEAEIVRDDLNQLIEWRSAPGSTIDTSGQVRFAKGLGDRGTEVHVYMTYTPPGGKVGHFMASLFGENPKRAIREDLRNFKRLMELGEILTIEGQPHGTCSGEGVEWHEKRWKPLFT